MTTKEKERLEAISDLKKMLNAGDTVYTLLRFVSRSGMTRGIDVYRMVKNERGICEPQWITAYVGKAIDNPQSRNDWNKQNGLRVTGCGMDMGFHIVYNLSSVLFRDGWQCTGTSCHSHEHHKRAGNPGKPYDGKTIHKDDGGYALRHQWL